MSMIKESESVWAEPLRDVNTVKSIARKFPHFKDRDFHLEPVDSKKMNLILREIIKK